MLSALLGTAELAWGETSLSGLVTSLWSEGFRYSPHFFSGSHPRAFIVVKKKKERKVIEQRGRELWPFVWEDSPDHSLVSGVVGGSLLKEQGVGHRPRLWVQRVDATCHWY